MALLGMTVIMAFRPSLASLGNHVFVNQATQSGKRTFFGFEVSAMNTLIFFRFREFERLGMSLLQWLETDGEAGPVEEHVLFLLVCRHL